MHPGVGGTPKFSKLACFFVHVLPREDCRVCKNSRVRFQRHPLKAISSRWWCCGTCGLNIGCYSSMRSLGPEIALKSTANLIEVALVCGVIMSLTTAGNFSQNTTHSGKNRGGSSTATKGRRYCNLTRGSRSMIRS
jgi:hypothetical protein